MVVFKVPRVESLRNETVHWGAQGGLLSVLECSALYLAVAQYRPHQVLEVGHFLGLSTAVLMKALVSQGRGALITVDHHKGDAWVPHSPEAPFLQNREKLFPEAVYLPMASQDLPDGLIRSCDFLFYDGDHGEEQLRFVQRASDLGGAQTIVLDDMDFRFGIECRNWLVEEGWREVTELVPRRGTHDKADADTYTLGIFRRDA